MGDLSQNFSRSEFQCRCNCGLGMREGDISEELISRLQIVRMAYSKPMRILSGLRCPAHNQNIKGSPTSSHMKGLAVDIEAPSGADMHKLVSKLIPFFKRMGIYQKQRFIHVDVDEDKPSPTIW